jgi:1-acyl-sn-glycerol-3-phosphate acyltransferase
MTKSASPERARESGAEIPPQSAWLYTFFRTILRILFRTLWRWEVHGRERLPATGGVILACNHASHLDPMIAGSFSPRILTYMARKSLFRSAFGWLILRCGAFPVDRGRDPRKALRTMGALLRSGRAVLIFPEGTRSRDGWIGTVRKGVGYLAARNNVPVLPLYIGGSFESWPRTAKLFRPRKLVVRAGELLEPREIDPDDATALKREEDRLQDAVEGALRRLEAGYARTAGKALPGPGV